MNELLTPQELAQYLKMSRATVMRKARNGEIPSIKIGKQFRFDKDRVDGWLLQKTVGRSLHILVVDDEPAIGKLFKDGLGRNGIQVTATESSSEALELAAKSHFDLIFLDLVMPEIDGSELFRRIRDIDKHVPVTIMTGYSDTDLMKEAMEQAPFLVMAKPFGIEDILGVVRVFAQMP